MTLLAGFFRLLIKCNIFITLLLRKLIHYITYYVVRKAIALRSTFYFQTVSACIGSSTSKVLYFLQLLILLKMYFSSQKQRSQLAEDVLYLRDTISGLNCHVLAEDEE